MTSDREALKRQAAERALEHVRDGMVLGLGTGSTMRHLLELLAERRRAGALGRITGVPTSRETAERARALGIPLATLEQEPRLDLALDGADEIDPRLDLIKGLGGALLWEKIVACAADRLVIIADESKLVNRLGERAPVPVEVVPFGWTTHLARLDRLGANAVLRTDAAGQPFVTDGGHYILDCRFEGGIPDPAALEAELCRMPGVVETGLFLGMAQAAVVAGEGGVRMIERPASQGGRA
jgi:ribose 5-phosphate isomerase A